MGYKSMVLSTFVLQPIGLWSCTCATGSRLVDGYILTFRLNQSLPSLTDGGIGKHSDSAGLQAAHNKKRLYSLARLLY